MTVIKVRARNIENHINQGFAVSFWPLERLPATFTPQCAQELAQHCATSCAPGWKA
jgi:hypothetical protein